MSATLPHIPAEVWTAMVDAMIEPKLMGPGVPHPAGRAVRTEVLERALEVAVRHGWVLGHV